ncbi:MAG: HAD-IA family hydrolase [Propionibacteriaceae bacterium]|jgi:HAD superfamily hydrolase (TIGR01509 family)|nr:HAD-IA family hydrolase [Propionibacteriaceae bacterium]
MDGYLFDLDGVLAPTAELHRRAWERMFAEFLASLPGTAAYTDFDYYHHLDGRPRCDGIADVLKSRCVELPWGSPDDPPDAITVCGLGNRKDAYFLAALDAGGLAPYPETVSVLRALDSRAAVFAVVSSSQNAQKVLDRTGLSGWFPHVVDGRYRVANGLGGKPAPDMFLAAADLVGLPPANCAVVEDAISGVAAGRAGGFGLVVGVDRGSQAQALLDAGADVVVDSLEGLL